MRSPFYGCIVTAAISDGTLITDKTIASGPRMQPAEPAARRRQSGPHRRLAKAVSMYCCSPDFHNLYFGAIPFIDFFCFDVH